MATRTSRAKKPTRRRKTTEEEPTTSRAATRPRASITVEDLEDFNESLNLLVYGDSGAGKTVLAGGAPNAVFISTEKGTISAKRMGSNAKLIRAESWEKLEAALDYLEANADKFEWVIIDSLTKMQTLLIRYILAVIHEENETRDLDIPAIQDHQKWQNMFKRFVDRIIDMPQNVIFTATAMHKEDAEGEDLVLPDIQGKDYAISQYVCAQMDGVYYLGVKTGKRGKETFTARRLLAKKFPPFFAKDRYNALGMWFELEEDDPDNIERIIQLIHDSADWEAYLADRNGKRSVAAEEADDEDEDAEEDEEPEEPVKRSVHARASRGTSKRPQARTRQTKPAEADPDDEEADDEEAEPEEATPRKARSARATRRPARTARQPRKRAKPAEEDESDFDPDDASEEIEFDD